MAKKSSFLLRGNTILKIQFELAPSNREIELLIAFFGLPNAIDNPLPLIVIEANLLIYLLCYVVLSLTSLSYV